MIQQTRENKHNRITTIIGHKGDGKSVLSESIALLSQKPVIFIDPTGTFPTTPKRRLYFAKPKDLILWLYKTENLKEFYRFRLELVCNATEANFAALAPVFRLCKVHFVIDEIDKFYTTTSGQNNIVYNLINFGRHLESDLTTSSRRPANISRNLTAQTDIFYFSKMREPNDIKFIADMLGSKDLLQKVRQMDKYHFLRVDDNGNMSIWRTNKKDIEILDKE